MPIAIAGSVPMLCPCPTTCKRLHLYDKQIARRAEREPHAPPTGMQRGCTGNSVRLLNQPCLAAMTYRQRSVVVTARTDAAKRELS